MSERIENLNAEENENIRIATQEDFALGEPPYFYSPYPDSLVLVREPETEGEKGVVALVNENWPMSINRMENLSEEEYAEGFSGSFIRNVLRSHYAPGDIMSAEEIKQEVGGTSRINEREEEESITVGDNEESSSEIPPEDSVNQMTPEEESWHKVFRMGVRAALQNEISEYDAYEAFGSGFVEGQKLKQEME